MAKGEKKMNREEVIALREMGVPEVDIETIMDGEYDVRNTAREHEQRALKELLVQEEKERLELALKFPAYTAPIDVPLMVKRVLYSAKLETFKFVAIDLSSGVTYEWKKRLNENATSFVTALMRLAKNEATTNLTEVTLGNLGVSGFCKRLLDDLLKENKLYIYNHEWLSNKMERLSGVSLYDEKFILHLKEKENREKDEEGWEEI